MQNRGLNVDRIIVKQATSKLHCDKVIFFPSSSNKEHLNSEKNMLYIIIFPSSIQSQLNISFADWSELALIVGALPFSPSVVCVQKWNLFCMPS